MTVTSATQRGLIRAAGALLWRRSSAGYEIAIIHRRRYDDWTLPKGKLNPGESWQQAALREVKEETGYEATLLGFAGAIAYPTDGTHKVVRFWHMMAVGKPTPQVDDEVAEVIWLPSEVAAKRVQYPLEQALLEVWCGPERRSHSRMSKSDYANVSAAEPNTTLRSFFLVNWYRAVKKRWRNFVRPVSLQRLENSIQTFQPELEALIEERQQDPHYKFVRGWDTKSKQLLETAKQALKDYDAELGWRCLKAADRFCLYGMGQEELVNEARLILAEASDEEKELSKWRKKSALELLANGTGKLKDSLNACEVFRAKRILDEHHDNAYHKLAILRTRLRLLTLVSLIVLMVWLIYPPIAPSLISLQAPTGSDAVVTNPLPNRFFWFAVILSGALGAIISGFSSSIARDQKKTRIPSELSTSIITFARLALAMVSAVAISVFLVSGVLNLPKPSYELLLAVAIVSGFSDRLLLRAIESLSKPS